MSYKTPVGPVEKLQMKLVQAQKAPGVGPVARMIAKSLGVQIPPQTFTESPYLPHRGTIVIHEKTRIGKGVTIFHGVTIGRGNPWEAPADDFSGFVIEDGVTLCAGAAIVSSHGTLTVGKGAVIGANAVLTQSAGPNEVWAGSPARLIKKLEQ